MHVFRLKLYMYNYDRRILSKAFKFYFIIILKNGLKGSLGFKWACFPLANISANNDNTNCISFCAMDMCLRYMYSLIFAVTDL